MLVMSHMIVGVDGWTQSVDSIQHDPACQDCQVLPAEIERQVGELILGEWQVVGENMGVKTQVRYEAIGCLSGAVRVYDVIAVTFVVLLGKNPTAERLLLIDMHKEMEKRFGGEVQEDILIKADRPLLVSLLWFVLAGDHYEDKEKLKTLGRETFARSGLDALPPGEQDEAKMKVDAVLRTFPMHITPAYALALYKLGK
jgi:hypothetical protein